MTPATSFVSKPSSLPMPWSSWTTWSPTRRSAKLASALPSLLSARGGRLRKTCVSASSTRPSSRQTNPRRAGATAKRSAGSAASASPSASIGASIFRRSAACRSASPRCANATTTRFPERTNPASSFSASARPRAAMAGRCASNACGCACGNGSSSVAPPRAIGARPSSSATRRTSFGCQTRSGARSTGGTRSAGISTTAWPSCSSGPSSTSSRSVRRSTAGWTIALSAGCSARCVNGEKARTCSISSPKSSTRSGSRPVDGNTSTMPPRTANWPRSSTRSTRSYPASASCSASPSIPGSSPTRSASGAGRAARGGSPSASAATDAQTSPPASRTSSAR